MSYNSPEYSAYVLVSYTGPRDYPIFLKHFSSADPEIPVHTEELRQAMHFSAQDAILALGKCHWREPELKWAFQRIHVTLGKLYKGKHFVGE